MRNLVGLPLFVLVAALLSCGGEPGSSEPAVEAPPAPAEETLPRHGFADAARPGQRAQIRAIVTTLPKSEAEWGAIGVALANEHPGAGSYLVQFFSDESTFDSWDGTALVRNSDWPHWLGRTSVATGADGALYAEGFAIAIDGETGEPRPGVLR